MIETIRHYWCDSKVVGARHPAELTVRIAGNSENLPAGGIETCVDHLGSTILDLLRNAPSECVQVKVLDPKHPLGIPKKRAYKPRQPREPVLVKPPHLGGGVVTLPEPSPTLVTK